MTGLGDVVQIESRGLTDGLNGSCEGKTRVKDESYSVWLSGMLVTYTEMEQVEEE